MWLSVFDLTDYVDRKDHLYYGVPLPRNPQVVWSEISVCGELLKLSFFVKWVYE